MGVRHEPLATGARWERLKLNHTTLVDNLGLVIVAVLAAWAALLTHMALVKGMDWAVTSGGRGRQGRSDGSEGTSFLRHRGRDGQVYALAVSSSLEIAKWGSHIISSTPAVGLRRLRHLLHFEVVLIGVIVEVGTEIGTPSRAKPNRELKLVSSRKWQKQGASLEAL
ncbi:hypothetical protein K438DRAFT_1783446 [Mycena galopus ATCC 62051]|nr:hypothetical protein K438DRAFT_1783446 [Mycena galopus ATCC 62051]